LDAESPEPSEQQVQEAHKWLDDIQNLVLNYENFVAANFYHFYPAWEELLGKVKRKSAQNVLSWIKTGVKSKFCGTKEAKSAKREIVVAMLRKVVPWKQIPAMLSGRTPHRVEFSNHQSLYIKWEFSQEQVAKLVETDAAGIWEEADPPKVINPMGVADSAGKDRLICNMKYPNLFLEALPFRYERLRDILGFTKQGSYIATWDLKSGYYHVPIHPEFEKYFGFKIGGITFYFKVLCFGFAQACYIFTKVMQEPVMELRKPGIPMSSYIDDALTAAITLRRCLRQSSLSAIFIGALGAFLGLPKCHLKPEQVQEWLGFIADAKEESFRISEKKLSKLKVVLEEAIGKPLVSARTLAKLAGKLISTSPAVLPASLFSRNLFQALKGKISWD
jgi:hypothetical protein